MSADLVLISETYWGNVHQTCTALNRNGLAQYVFSFECVSGSDTIVVLRMPRDTAIFLSEKGLIGTHYKEKLK